VELEIEGPVPYDQSAIWRIHDAYYSAKGVAAWTTGDVPYAATSNSGVARQHARLLVDLVRELVEDEVLGPDDPVTVLEVGSGLGSFCMNFVDALAHGCGEEGRAVVGRLRYLLSDYAEKNLEEALNQPVLARLVNEGTVVPMLFDLTDPTNLSLEGVSPAAARKAKRGKGKGKARRPEGDLVAVIFNYIACITPIKVLRWTGQALVEKHVRLTIDVADTADAKRVAGDLATIGEPGELPRKEVVERLVASTVWSPVPGDGEAAADRDLSAVFPEEHHQALVGELFARLGPATINYPYVFLDLLRGLRPRLVRGGLLLVSDFGTPERSDIQAPTAEREAWHYGMSLAHDVDFVVLDVFAAREGLAVARTRDGLLDLHTVALRSMDALPASFVEAFDASYVRRERGQELLDLSAAAAVSYDAGRHAEAARLYAQCLRLAPRSTQVILRHAQACLAANLQSETSLRRLARRIRLGRRLDVAGKIDFDTLLAGVHVRLGEPARARKLLERSIERQETAAKRSALAVAFEKLGEWELAYAEHRRALALEPEGEAADLTRRRLVRYLGEQPPYGRGQAMA
jgi:tetratricopeptide (TPR) repeat protein